MGACRVFSESLSAHCGLFVVVLLCRPPCRCFFVIPKHNAFRFSVAGVMHCWYGWYVTSTDLSFASRVNIRIGYDIRIPRAVTDDLVGIYLHVGET